MGLDSVVLRMAEEEGLPVPQHLEPRTFATLPAPSSMRATHLLVIGTESPAQFRYEHVRTFALDSLLFSQQALPDARTVGMTLHGPGLGLDEEEAFAAEVNGLRQALEAGTHPPKLERILITERDERRAARMRKLLHQIAPGTGSATATGINERIREAGETSESKPHVFVAMDFDEEHIDTYQYGIHNPVNELGLLCERTDEQHFVGDIMTRLLDRLRTAELVVADLTTRNPNVYLEVGLAWGFNVDTVLVMKTGTELPFDVQGHKVIQYSTIIELERKLSSTLRELLPGRA